MEMTDQTSLPALSVGMHKARAAFRNTSSNRARPLVSILIFAYNNLQQHTRYCIDSILRHTANIDYELVLLDNGSTDGTLDYFKSIPYARKKIVRITENKGANYGQHIASKHLAGRYVAMIANDVYVTENWLSNMIRCAESDDRIGFLATVSDNISNLQAVNLAFDSLEEMQLKAAQYNISDPRKWEERLRLMPAIALYKRECLDIAGSLDYAFQHDFSDDDISFRIRRAGYKLICCGDVFVHHSGSSTAGSDEKKMAVLKRGKEIFSSKYYGIDAWDDINNFELLMLELVNPEEKRNTPRPEVLGIDVRCGTPILQIKNKLRLADVFDTRLSAFVQDPKYWLDLKTICEGLVAVDRIEYLKERFPAGSFDYILIGQPINAYADPDRVLNDALSLLRINGQLLIKIRNDFDVNTFLCSLGKDFGGSSRPVTHSDIENLHRRLMEKGCAIRNAIKNLYDFDAAVHQAIRNVLQGTGSGRDIDAAYHDLLVEEYVLKITKHTKHRSEQLMDAVIPTLLEYFSSDEPSRSAAGSGKETGALDKLLRSGEEQFENGNYRESVLLFQKALQLDPRNTQAMNNLGVLVWQTGDIPAAMKIFLQVLTLDPGNPDAFVNFASSIRESGRHDLIVPAMVERLRPFHGKTPEFSELERLLS